MYTFAILFLAAFAFLDVFYPETVKKYKVVFAFSCFSFLVFHDGFRWETGCDWNPYSFYFEHLLSDYSLDNPVYEVGYYIFMFPIRLVTDNYTVYLIIHALFFYGCCFFFIFKYSTNPFVSIFLLYMITVPQMGTNRQYLAIAIFLIGLYYLMRNEKLMFVGAVLVASTIHISALLCLTAFFINSRIKQVYLLLILAFSVAIAFSGVVNIIAPYLTMFIKDDGLLYKFDYYTVVAQKGSVLSMALSLLRRTVWLLLLMVFDHRIKNKPNYYYLLFNLYFISCVMYVLLNGTVLQLLVSRGLLYFNIVEMMIIPYILFLFVQNWGKVLVMLTIVGYAYISIFKGFSNYGEGNDVFLPYKGLFINTEYERIDKG